MSVYSRKIGCVFSVKRYEEWNFILLEKRKLVCFRAAYFWMEKIKWWIQKVMEGLWEVDPEKTVLCMVRNAKFRMNLKVSWWKT